MREHLEFLKFSSTVVKAAAWIFLCLGLVGSAAIFLGRLPGKTTLDGVVNLVSAIFFFFLFYVIAKIVELLIKIVSAIGGSASGGNEIRKE